VNDGTVEFKVAKAAANNPADFDLKMNTFGGGSAGSSVAGQQNMAGDQNMADEMNAMFGGGG